MFNNTAELEKLLKQNIKLKKENALLRASLREIINTAHQAINHQEENHA